MILATANHNLVFQRKYFRSFLHNVTACKTSLKKICI